MFVFAERFGGGILNTPTGGVDPPSHLGRPLVRTVRAVFPHTAPDSYDKIKSYSVRLGKLILFSRI